MEPCQNNGRSSSEDGRRRRRSIHRVSSVTQPVAMCWRLLLCCSFFVSCSAKGDRVQPELNHLPPCLSRDPQLCAQCPEHMTSSWSDAELLAGPIKCDVPPPIICNEDGTAIVFFELDGSTINSSFCKTHECAYVARKYPCPEGCQDGICGRPPRIPMDGTPCDPGDRCMLSGSTFGGRCFPVPLTCGNSPLIIEDCPYLCKLDSKQVGYLRGKKGAKISLNRLLVMVRPGCGHRDVTALAARLPARIAAQYPEMHYYELEIPWPRRALLDHVKSALEKKMGEPCLDYVNYVFVGDREYDERVR